MTLARRLMAVKLAALDQAFENVHLCERRTAGEMVAGAEGARIAPWRKFGHAQPGLGLCVVAPLSKTLAKLVAFRCRVIALAHLTITPGTRTAGAPYMPRTLNA